MKKVIVIVIVIVQSVILSHAQVKLDTVAHNEKEYNPELGYFQKAYSDKGDPRFMFTDREGKFAIGIGGTIHATTFYDFNGTVDKPTSKFTPEKIAVPTDYSKHFGLDAVSSEAHIKVRSKLGKHQIIGYISGSVNDDELFKLDKAYVSFDGLTIGRTYSFFADLRAGARTSDLQGINSEISTTHALIGYTHNFGEKWTVGASVERPDIKATEYQQWGLSKDHQAVPDIVVKGVYKWKNGHIQLAGIHRTLSYWLHLRGSEGVGNGESKRTNGWGGMLSGSYKFCPSFKMSAQGFYGEGISRYVNSMGDLNADLASGDFNPSTGLVMNAKPVPVYGGFMTATYNWTPQLYSSVIVGYNAINLKDPMQLEDLYDNAFYGAANIFWDIDDYCYIGLEYNYGRRHNRKSPYVTTPDKNNDRDGHANRLNATFVYQF